MWFSRVLNAERLKKIKANRETFSFKADKLTIYNFFFTTSLIKRVFGASDSFPKPIYIEVKPFPAGLVTGWETSKDANCCQEHTTKNSILMPKNAN